MAVEFAAVMWTRRMLEALEPLRALRSDDLGRLGPLIQGMESLAEQGIELSDQQFDALKSSSEECGKSISEFVSVALEQFLSVQTDRGRQDCRQRKTERHQRID